MADPRIELGARVCEQIKKALYKDIPWGDCYKQIANDFSIIKTLNIGLRVKYPGDLEYIKYLGNYGEEDIRDMLEG